MVYENCEPANSRVERNACDLAFIRSTRRKLGLTQKQAGRIFGGGVNAFSRYERGITSPPKSLLALLTILDMHPELLVHIGAEE